MLDDLHIFEVNRAKQNHMRRYREGIFRSAMGNRRQRVEKVVEEEEVILIEEEEVSQVRGRGDGEKGEKEKVEVGRTKS